MPKPSNLDILGIAPTSARSAATTDRNLLDHRETAPVPMPDMMDRAGAINERALEQMTAASIEGGSTSSGKK